MQRIVVGVDATPASEQALEWALDEARLHGAHVDLVTVYTDLSLTGATAALPHVPIRRQYETAQGIIEEALHAVYARRPDLLTVVVQQELIEDASADHALLAASESADLLVVGARSRGRLASALLHSTSATCAHRATAPVAVIHAPLSDRTHPRSAETGRVVVGVDESPVSATALHWAADEAQVRNAPLIVVTAWSFSVSGMDAAALHPDAQPAQRREEHRLARQRTERVVQAALGEHARPVKIRSMHGAPAEVLDIEAGDGDLLVIGCRGHGALRRSLVGSTTTELMQRRRGPLVVTHAVPA